MAWRRRIMLSRKSAVISKFPVTRDSLMRSPPLLPVCLRLHSILSFSRLLSVSLSLVSLHLMDPFHCQGLFSACLFVVEQVKYSI